MTSLPRPAMAIAFSVAITAGFLGSQGAWAQSENTEITIVLPEGPANLEPCSSVLSHVGRIIKQNVVEMLTEISPEDGSVSPRLAESWEQIDADTWRYHLRDGVTFHDGTPFNADAVVFSITRIMSPDITCVDRGKMLGGVSLSAEKVDDLTVDISGDSAMPISPTMMGAVAMVSPNTPANEATREPIGTGPYKFVSWVPEAVVLDRNDEYWGDEPEISRVTYVFRSDSAVRAAMVATGEADLAPEISPQDATNPDTDFSYFNSETSRFRIGATQPPLDDIRVRRAINLAVDREALHGTVFSKDAVIATQLVVPAINGYNPDIPVWKYDPEEAKRLLAEAAADGVAVDTPIRIIGRTGIYPNAAEAAEALMSMWQEVGFNMTLNMLEVAEWMKYSDKPYPEDRGPTLLQDQVDNATGDALSTAYPKYHTDGQTSEFSDPTLDAVLEKAVAATGDERREAWQEAFRMVQEDFVLEVPLFHMVGYTRVGPRIDWRPSLATNSEIQVARIKLRD